MANPLTMITSLGGKAVEKGCRKAGLGPHWAHRFRHQTQWQ